MQERGFETLRYIELRDNIAAMLEEVTSHVKVDPVLQPLSGEEIKGSQSKEARYDISTRGFWIRGQKAFFDNRVFDLNTQRHQILLIYLFYLFILLKSLFTVRINDSQS